VWIGWDPHEYAANYSSPVYVLGVSVRVSVDMGARQHTTPQKYWSR